MAKPLAVLSGKSSRPRWLKKRGWGERSVPATKRSVRVSLHRIVDLLLHIFDMLKLGKAERLCYQRFHVRHVTELLSFLFLIGLYESKRKIGDGFYIFIRSSPSESF